MKLARMTGLAFVGDGSDGPKPGRLAHFVDRARQSVDFAAWGSIDLRALGVFRIAIGAIAVVDVARRLPLIELFYSNNGLLSNHFGLFLPLHSRAFDIPECIPRKVMSVRR